MTRDRDTPARDLDLHAGLLDASDMEAGQTFELGTYHVTSQELTEFASRWDPQWFHTDEDAAAHGPYGGLIASGIHTIGIYQRLSVEAVRWDAIAGRCLREVRFLRPVRPGDNLTGTTEITAIERDPDRHRALVTSTGRLINQHGKEVFSISTEAYIRQAENRSVRA